jgi:hypothetical protein
MQQKGRKDEKRKIKQMERGDALWLGGVLVGGDVTCGR